MTVFPFIVRRIYEGDAFLLSMMMVIFYCGATTSSLVMMRFMPLERPGRIFLLMQLSRMFILGIMWLQPALWVFAIAAVLWGINMGVTLTLARTIVQESATEEFRGRIMSVFTLGLLGSAPIGAIVLGFMIEVFGTLNALLPAMLLSLGLFLYGVSSAVSIITNLRQVLLPPEAVAVAAKILQSCPRRVHISGIKCFLFELAN